MSINLIRVTHSRNVLRSILLDKIDKSQGNSPGYASKAKQKVYVPYSNPLDSSVAGYVDLVPTDEVLLASAPGGVISGLSDAGQAVVAVVASTLVTTPTVSAATNVGLSSTIALANALKADYNAHRILTAGSVHGAADSTNATTSADATDLASLITLLNELKTDYNAHRILTAGGVHGAADTTNAITTSNATTLATASALASALKSAYNAHRILTAGSVHGAADTVNGTSAALTSTLGTVITGTTFLSVSPDVTYVTFTDLSGNVQKIPSSSFSSIGSTQIVIPDSAVTLGVPTTGWTVRVQSNSKLSNTFTMT